MVKDTLQFVTVKLYEADKITLDQAIRMTSLTPHEFMQLLIEKRCLDQINQNRDYYILKKLKSETIRMDGAGNCFVDSRLKFITTTRSALQQIIEFSKIDG